MMLTARRGAPWGLGLLLVGAASCGGDEKEASSVRLPVLSAPAASAPVTTDLEYEITLSRCQFVIDELVFTEEVVEQAARPWWSWLIGQAHAHPGHGAGGVVLGELFGHHVVDCLEGVTLGEGTFLTGTYGGADFLFTTATTDDVPEGDPLVGHTLIFEGQACRAGECVEFQSVVDQDAGRALAGAPMSLSLSADAQPQVALRLVLVDPVEGDTLFDGIDFDALKSSEDMLTFDVGSAPYNLLVRRTQSHDFYLVETQETP
ncbi:MAG: hypothetical protein ACE366_14795 [Bradymonadia bacterium]